MGYPLSFRFWVRLVVCLGLLAATFRVRPAEAAAVLHVYPGDSISAALSQVSAGDTIFVHAGTYSPQVVLARFSRPVTIEGESRDAVVVRGFNFQGAAQIRVRRMTVTGVDSTSPSAILVKKASSHLTFEDLRIDPTHEAGVDIVEGSHDIRIVSSVITGEHAVVNPGRGRNIHIGSGNTDLSKWVSNIEVISNHLSKASADAIQIAGANNVLIEGNTFRDLQQNGDHNDAIQSVASDGLRILRNVFTAETDQDQSIILGHLGGAVGPPPHPNMKVRNTLVANNLVHHWRGPGITLSGTINTDVVNNTSMDNRRPSGNYPGLVLGTTYHENEGLRIFNNILSDIYVTGSGAPPAYQARNIIPGKGAGPLDLKVDPKFEDRVLYRLASDSPAVDYAQVDGAPAVDLDGSARIGIPDAGARELANGLPPSTQPPADPLPRFCAVAFPLEGHIFGTNDLPYSIVRGFPSELRRCRWNKVPVFGPWLGGDGETAGE